MKHFFRGQRLAAMSVLLGSLLAGAVSVYAATTIGTDISTDGSLTVTGLTEGAIPFVGSGGTFGTSADLTHDTTTTDFSLNNNSFAPLTIRGTYTGTGSTNRISGQNTEVVVTPTDAGQYVQAIQASAANEGSGDSTYLIGAGINAYAQGSGHTTNIAGYIADAELPGSGGAGSASSLSDFHSYGIYNSPGTTVSDAYHFWADTGGIAGTVTNLYGVGIATPSVSGTVTNAYQLWAGDLAGVATNPYYSWFDSRGVRRVKEDSTFNGVGQAIEALYNPQFTKYTPGATDYERVVLGEWNSNVAEIGTENGGTGSARGLALLTASTTRLTISPAGNVGIGTTSPATKLQISAGANATTTVTIGELGLSSSKGCVNMNKSDGQAASFYINAANTLVVEPNYCR